ncbi:hypothetical protein AAVH_28728 [Aphelenchoides avenae]|nr:hypothetical protein AAVH_28728 [Aphelenchus avenae]
MYGVDSLVYTIEVAVGQQRFNLTLDPNAQAAVLFEKGYVPPSSSCRFDWIGNPTGETGDAPRNFFERE